MTHRISRKTEKKLVSEPENCYNTMNGKICRIMHRMWYLRTRRIAALLRGSVYGVQVFSKQSGGVLPAVWRRYGKKYRTG